MSLQKIRKKTAGSFVFLHGSKTCAYEQIPDVGQKIMGALDRHMQKQKIEALGPALWCYEEASKGKLKLRAGFPVKKGTRGKAPLTARLEPEWKCLSAEFTGPMTKIIEAWLELFEAAEKKGIHYTDERREIYRKWMAFDSKANVTELQIRLNPEK